MFALFSVEKQVRNLVPNSCTRMCNSPALLTGVWRGLAGHWLLGHGEEGAGGREYGGERLGQSPACVLGAG